MYTFQAIMEMNIFASEDSLLREHGFCDAPVMLANDRCARAVKAALAAEFPVPSPCEQGAIFSRLPQSSFGLDGLVETVRDAASLKPRLALIAERSGATLVTEPENLRDNLARHNGEYYLRLRLPDRTRLAIGLKHAPASD